MHIPKVFILFIIVNLLMLNIFAQEKALSKAEVQDFQERISEKAENLETLDANFVQTKHMKMMNGGAESEGKVYYKSPDLLKWEYEQPYDYKVLFKDGRLYINDEGEKSITDTKSNKLFENLGKLVSGSVNGKLLQDVQNFDISFYEEEKQMLAKVTPKDEDLASMFSEIVLFFDEQDLVRTVELREEAGDYTRIQFKNVKLNETLPESIFEE